jgi:glutathione synthase/RimK-type ligase-like ATP-grasp enzyme
MNNIVLLLGVPNEPPLALVASALHKNGVRTLIWDQQKVTVSNCKIQIENSNIAGILSCPEWIVSLEDVVGVYTRLASWATLPEIKELPPTDPRSTHASTLHLILDEWLEVTPARVINRTSANDSNNSKPYQALMIRRHFYVPETLVTNQPDAALDFCSQHPRTIYKSISGERSIVTEFDTQDMERLNLLQNSPIQLQEWISGFDVRVHVVGDRAFATRVESAAIDYRYDYSINGAGFTAYELPADVEDACIQLTAEMKLGLAGLDLRFTNDGRVFCFEVNPSPAYSVFESSTAQPIAEAIALYLAGS